MPNTGGTNACSGSKGGSTHGGRPGYGQTATTTGISTGGTGGDVYINSGGGGNASGGGTNNGGNAGNIRLYLGGARHRQQQQRHGGSIILFDSANIVVQVTYPNMLGFYGVTPTARATTSIGAAAFVAGSGTAVNSASTFGGYTIAQIVAALQALGLLT